MGRQERHAVHRILIQLHVLEHLIVLQTLQQEIEQTVPLLQGVIRQVTLLEHIHQVDLQEEVVTGQLVVVPLVLVEVLREAQVVAVLVEQHVGKH